MLAFYANLSRKYEKQVNLFNCFIMKIPIRATQNKQTGRQFEMPGLEKRFSTDGSRPANGSWHILNGSWKVFRNNMNVCKSALIDKT